MQAPMAPRRSRCRSVDEHLLSAALLAHLEREGADRPALLSGSERISYGQLASATARGAAEIDSRFPRGSRLLLASRDQLELGLAFLATLASGSVPLLADPIAPDRLRGLVERWRPAGAIGDEALLAHLALPTLGRSHVRGWLEGDAPRLVLAPVRPDEAAFWTFTSGTTGEPRAVVHGHAGPRAAFQAFSRGVVGLAPDDVVCSTAGLPFVYALGNALLFPLMAGAAAVLASDLLLPTVLAEMRRHRATVLVSGPWSLEALVRLARRSEWRSSLRRLRRVLSAGEPLPAPLFERWRQELGREVLDNFGCTEMFNSFVSSRPGHAAPGVLGEVVPGFELRVGGRPAGAGARGPLAVRGPSRAVAVSTPAAEEPVPVPADGLCETGDEVEVDDLGRLVFLGRIDDRFKVRGQFIHPLEIERKLLEVPGVRECLLAPTRDPSGLAAARAFVVAEPDADVQALRHALRRTFRERLPPSLRSAAIELVAQLPRSERGKLLRPRRAAG